MCEACERKSCILIIGVVAHVCGETIQCTYGCVVSCPMTNVSKRLFSLTIAHILGALNVLPHLQAKPLISTNEQTDGQPEGWFRVVLFNKVSTTTRYHLSWTDTWYFNMIRVRYRVEIGDSRKIWKAVSTAHTADAKSESVGNGVR